MLTKQIVIPSKLLTLHYLTLLYTSYEKQLWYSIILTCNLFPKIPVKVCIYITRCKVTEESNSA